MDEILRKLPIYVISLKRYPNRRRTMKERLGKRGLDFEFFDATDDKSILSPEDRKFISDEQLKNPPDDFYTGTFGCLISHLRCYTKLLASEHPYALILEDDATLPADTIPVLSMALKMHKHWNLLQLGHWEPYKGQPWIGKSSQPLNFLLRRRLKIAPELLEADRPYYIGYPVRTLHGSHAFLINRVAAKFILDNYRHQLQPVDFMFNDYNIPHRLAISPCLSAQDPKPGMGDFKYIDNPKKEYSEAARLPFDGSMPANGKWLKRLILTILFLFSTKTVSYYRNKLKQLKKAFVGKRA